MALRESTMALMRKRYSEIDRDSFFLYSSIMILIGKLWCGGGIESVGGFYSKLQRSDYSQEMVEELHGRERRETM